MCDIDLRKVDEIIDKYQDQDGVLIQLLLDLQSEFNWIPKEAIARVSDRLRIPRSQIFRIASFYKAMSLSPVGKNVVQVCMGTACKVRGAQKILDLIESRLKISQGETTPDMIFSLRRVNCLGCCAMGPVIIINEDYHGCAATEEVDKIFKKYD
ncbi:MAG: NAD(P)H-dependent oxidoreductase subunit E [Methanotrichaceae archaeon]|nr:NAD(P)H-dependent oxidoreductase subunit E [Methanotrichaceae archaeon]